MAVLLNIFPDDDDFPRPRKPAPPAVPNVIDKHVSAYCLNVLVSSGYITSCPGDRINHPMVDAGTQEGLAGM